MPAARAGPSVAGDAATTHEGGRMPVGEILLYAIWRVIAIGSIIATAMVLRGDGS
jgi:hypothetical protein